MLQRRMKSLAVLTTICLLFTACKQKTFSTDEPLLPTYTPSVFISSQNKLFYAIDPYTGKYKWEYNLRANVIATPVVAGEFVYVPSADSLFKFYAKSGVLDTVLAWAPTAENLSKFYSSPVTDGKTVYLATITGKLFALDVNTDKVKWVYNAEDSVLASLVMYNGNIIVANTKGSIRAVNMLNGALAWQTSVPVPVGSLVSSPAVSGPYIYVGSTDNKMHALYSSNGTAAWDYTTNGVIDGSPIVYGGNIIFGSADNYVYCIDSTAKTERWKFKTNDRVLSTAGAYAQVVYIGGYDSYLYALNIIDGSLRWKYLTGALIQSCVLATDGSVYSASFDKHLYKFDTSGTLKWRYNIGGPIQTSPVFYDLNKAYYPSITGVGPY